jgi:hypothetical protein
VNEAAESKIYATTMLERSPTDEAVFLVELLNYEPMETTDVARDVKAGGTEASEEPSTLAVVADLDIQNSMRVNTGSPNEIQM